MAPLLNELNQQGPVGKKVSAAFHDTLSCRIEPAAAGQQVGLLQSAHKHPAAVYLIGHQQVGFAGIIPISPADQLRRNSGAEHPAQLGKW